VASPIDDFCEQLRSELHAKKLKSQADLDLVKQLISELEVARQAQLVATFSEQKGLRPPTNKGASSAEIARKLLAAVQAISEVQNAEPSLPRPGPAAEPRRPLDTPVRELPQSPPDDRPEDRTLWPQLLKCDRGAPIVVVGGSPRPEKLDATLGALSDRVEWIETSRHGTHAIGNLAQRIRQRRVSALIVLDAVVGHKHSDPLVSAAREVRIPTTYAHKGGVAALARAFTQLEKMVGAR
jgi:hypothetical protein